MPRARGAALVGVCRALADGELVLDPGVDRSGIGGGPAVPAGDRAVDRGLHRDAGLGDPDVMLAGDLGVRHAVAALGGDDRAREIERAAHAWRPWRSYAVAHLWASLEPVQARTPSARVAIRCCRRPTDRAPRLHDPRRPPRRGGPHGRRPDDTRDHDQEACLAGARDTGR